MKLDNPTLLCFPGFLGLSSDFEFLKVLDLRVEVVDIFGQNAPKQGEEWEQWQERLLAQLNKKYASSAVVLVGYSMGARISLKLMAENPTWLKAAILISCHPGLKTEYERKERIESDLAWARRFKEENWDSVIELWNKQDVFANSSSAIRSENQFDKEVLSRVLCAFSLGKQSAPNVISSKIPIQLIWGLKDLKFAEFAKSMQRTCPAIKACEVPEAGHRVCLDNPSYLVENIRHFLNSEILSTL